MQTFTFSFTSKDFRVCSLGSRVFRDFGSWWLDEPLFAVHGCVAAMILDDMEDEPELPEPGHLCLQIGPFGLPGCQQVRIFKSTKADHTSMLKYALFALRGA